MPPITENSLSEASTFANPEIALMLGLMRV
jgi:hypothetical protein